MVNKKGCLHSCFFPWKSRSFIFGRSFSGRVRMGDGREGGDCLCPSYNDVLHPVPVQLGKAKRHAGKCRNGGRKGFQCNWKWSIGNKCQDEEELVWISRSKVLVLRLIWIYQFPSKMYVEVWLFNACKLSLEKVLCVEQSSPSPRRDWNNFTDTSCPYWLFWLSKGYLRFYFTESFIWLCVSVVWEFSDLVCLLQAKKLSLFCFKKREVEMMGN